MAIHVTFKAIFQKFLANAKDILNKIISLGIPLGFSPHLTTADRRVLEQQILPYFADSPNFHHVLFIGCEWYTKSYEKIFTGKDYWTLDKDPQKATYGSKKHICDEFKNINKHFAEESLDLIICNGVLGWGLNNPKEIDLAVLHSYQCLRKNGVLILGWNDTPEHRIDLDSSQSLKKFQPYYFSPLAMSSYRTHSKNAHVYNFYIKG